MSKLSFLFILFFIGLAAACVNSTPQEDSKQETPSGTSMHDNPNGAKPLARMMRTMTIYCDSMRLDILAGRRVDSIRYPMPDFIDAEPTEKDVKTPIFYAIGTDFQAAYRRLMSDTLHQAENYMAVIQQCRACHMNFCSGPLRKIDKLGLE